MTGHTELRGISTRFEQKNLKRNRLIHRSTFLNAKKQSTTKRTPDRKPKNTDTVKTSVYFRLGCNLCQPRSYKLNRKSAMTPEVTRKSTANKRENKKSTWFQLLSIIILLSKLKRKTQKTNRTIIHPMIKAPMNISYRTWYLLPQIVTSRSKSPRHENAAKIAIC